MGYKIKGAIQRNRNRFIIFGLLWVVLFVMIASPLACILTDATANGSFSFEVFLQGFGKYIVNPLKTITICFESTYIKMLGNVTLYFTITYLVVLTIGIIRSAPKNRYTDIEHGSSDWSEHGEQYQVLSKTEGLILAEDNYLPLDKMGNINVLIVGRFRFW